LCSLEGAEDIAGRDLWQMQTLLKQSCLSTLTGARRPYQHYDLRHTGVLWVSQRRKDAK